MIILIYYINVYIVNTINHILYLKINNDYIFFNYIFFILKKCTIMFK